MVSFASAFLCLSFFIFNDTATTEIYTLTLHDALPISTGWDIERWRRCSQGGFRSGICGKRSWWRPGATRDRKSTRLNSSHGYISYAVFCLKKKKKTKNSSDRVGLLPRRAIHHTERHPC